MLSMLHMRNQLATFGVKWSEDEEASVGDELRQLWKEFQAQEGSGATARRYLAGS